MHTCLPSCNYRQKIKEKLKNDRKDKKRLSLQEVMGEISAWGVLRL